MARTVKFSGNVEWTLEDNQTAAKMPLACELSYTSSLQIEKVYTAVVTDEVIALPMASAKFLVLKALTNDVTIKLNNSTTDIPIKAGTGFVLIWNPDGAITSLKVSIGVAPATLKGYAFA